MPKLPEEVIRSAKKRVPVSFWIATWFGCGLSPIAPGTVGAVGSIPICLLLMKYGPIALVAAALLLTVVGIFVSARLAAATYCKDPQIVVIDEVAGMCLTMAFAPANWKGVVVAFVLFRLFDITKPPPCRWIERRLSPGPGIMLDDIMAAIWAGAVLMGIRFLGWL
ncbi:MAG: phosphatidylglycerophosphatase A [Polyangiaceae bacterium]|nr:phosphatidylglycerophosphatase A [Polyangiaceae bacterium]